MKIEYTMKQIIYVYILLMGMLLVSCSDDKEDDIQSLSIAAFYPEVVMEGTEITITGHELQSVTEVIFGSGVSSSQITQVNGQMLRVIVPIGLDTSAAPITIKSATDQATSRQLMRLAQPSFDSFQFTDAEGAKTNEAMSIYGADLLLVDYVEFSLNGISVKVPALLLVRKSNSAIKVVIPDDAPKGIGVSVSLGFKNGFVYTLPELLEIKEGTGEDGPSTDPITEHTIMLNDFQPYNGHDCGWDMSWSAADCHDFPTDEEGNIYFHSLDMMSGWIFNCNHQNWLPTVSDIADYAIKFDLLIEPECVGAETASMQYVIADGWHYWIGTGFFPSTTNGKWITITRNISDINPTLTGEVNLAVGTNGLYGENMPAGICIDNLRLDPKED